MRSRDQVQGNKIMIKTHYNVVSFNMLFIRFFYKKNKKRHKKVKYTSNRAIMGDESVHQVEARGVEQLKIKPI